MSVCHHLFDTVLRCDGREHYYPCVYQGCGARQYFCKHRPNDHHCPRAFAAQLAQSFSTVQPVRWPYLDTVLTDWWYETVEQSRATDDGMPEQRLCI